MFNIIIIKSKCKMQKADDTQLYIKLGSFAKLLKPLK